MVDSLPGRRVRLVDYSVIRSSPADDLGQRLAVVHGEISAIITAQRPDVVAVERVFAQKNTRTAMATAQAAAVALLAATQAGLPIALHTPSEVKAAVTGSGRADKQQVAVMVMRLLRLPEQPTPADAADALALAICHSWRAPLAARLSEVIA